MSDTEDARTRPGQDELIRAAFAELHQEFSQKLPARLESAATAIRAALAAREDLALREEARGSAHKLRGSTGTYGFPAISETAGRIEDAFVELNGSPSTDPGAPWARIVAALAELEGAAREP